jgi:phosphoglycolate phosphatase-like HAD superfamily hydrolase
MKVLLFDIDGTLMLSGGAGLRAMNQAFFDLYGVEEVFSGINLAGRTDTSIFRDAAEAHHHPYTAETLRNFQNAYYAHLPGEMEKPIGDKKLMPGVAELLPALQQRPDVYVGLLTGNWEISGFIKLAHFGLDRFFSFGAFADDSEKRPELLPYAIKRFTERYDRTPDPDQVFVIGDTPSDILCAQPHNAKAVAVAAAHYKEKDLQPYNPDYLLPDLSDLPQALSILG